MIAWFDMELDKNCCNSFLAASFECQKSKKRTCTVKSVHIHGHFKKTDAKKYCQHERFFPYSSEDKMLITTNDTCVQNIILPCRFVHKIWYFIGLLGIAKCDCSNRKHYLGSNLSPGMALFFQFDC